MLEETLELARDSNYLIHKIRRAGKWSMVFTFVYWFVILGGLAVGYYFIQPYVDTMLKAYTQVQAQIDGFKNFTR